MYAFVSELHPFPLVVMNMERHSVSGHVQADHSYKCMHGGRNSMDKSDNILPSAFIDIEIWPNRS